MNTLTIQLPDKLTEDLQSFSDQQKLSVDEIIQESVRRYITVEKYHLLQKSVLSIAESQGIHSDENVFRIVS